MTTAWPALNVFCVLPQALLTTPPGVGYHYCSHVTDEEERLTHPVLVEGGGWVDRKQVRLQRIASDGLGGGLCCWCKRMAPRTWDSSDLH